MNEKQKNCEIDSMAKKKRRTHKLHTIETKMDIIKRSKNGESYASIGRSYDINRSTICSILKNKDKIKEYVENCGNMSSKIVSKRHGIVMDEMEKSLSYWISDQNQKNVPMCTSMIQERALSLHKDWKARLKDDSNTVFHASNGWFSKFKTRYSLHNVKFTGESADADGDAAKDFISSLSKIIEDGKYTSSQIFNVDETGLLWKKMPNRTFLSKDESVAPDNENSIKIESEEEEPEEIKTLTLKNMNEAFTHLEKFLNIMEECDPNGERISQVRREINNSTVCYRSIYEEKKKNNKIQLILDKFLKRT